MRVNESSWTLKYANAKADVVVAHEARYVWRTRYEDSGEFTTSASFARSIRSSNALSTRRSSTVSSPGAVSHEEHYVVQPQKLQ